MASDYCLNANCGHHRKEHKRGTGQCTKCSCAQARYTEAEKGHFVKHGPGKHGNHGK